MPFKINISVKGGKTFKVESENESLIGKKIGDSFSGSEISKDLQGYELKITGTSDRSGFPGMVSQTGSNLRKVLFTQGPFFRKVKNKGLRRKKNVRGNEISVFTIQINTMVVKEGAKKLEDIFGKKEVAVVA